MKRPKKFFMDIQEEIEALKDQGFEPVSTPTDLWVYKNLCVVWGEENPQLMVMQKKEVDGEFIVINSVIIETTSLGSLDHWQQRIPISQLPPQCQQQLFNQLKNKK